MNRILVAIPCFLAAIAAYGQGNGAANPFGNPIGTTVQLPTFGVSFDANGVLNLKTFSDPDGELLRERFAAAKRDLTGNLTKAVKQRKISLVRLEAALNRCAEAGVMPDESILSLAGLTRITSAFCYPDDNDIVLVGPAEPWIRDFAGNPIGLVSGRPILRLEDLAVAIRAFRPKFAAKAFVGCTISPQREGLAKLQAFQRKIPRSVADHEQAEVARWVASGVRDSLGSETVQVFGISAKTNFARVMIEADYRMKRIAVGVEQPPIRMTTFASALSSASDGLQRWWFTPNYKGIMASPDHLAVKIVGQGVQLQTENKEVNAAGVIIDSGRKPTRATRAYATSFTNRYDEIAKAAPVYGQLRQLTDWLIIAAFLQKNDWYRLAKWDASILCDESVLPTETMNNPESAPVVVNAFWKKRRMFTPAGGGVSIEPLRALERVEIDPGFKVLAPRKLPVAIEAWWWD